MEFHIHCASSLATTYCKRSSHLRWPLAAEARLLRFCSAARLRGLGVADDRDDGSLPTKPLRALLLPPTRLWCEMAWWSFVIMPNDACSLWLWVGAAVLYCPRSGWFARSWCQTALSAWNCSCWGINNGMYGVTKVPFPGCIIVALPVCSWNRYVGGDDWYIGIKGINCQVGRICG